MLLLGYAVCIIDHSLTRLQDHSLQIIQYVFCLKSLYHARCCTREFLSNTVYGHEPLKEGFNCDMHFPVKMYLDTLKDAFRL